MLNNLYRILDALYIFAEKKTWQKILNTVRKRVSQLDFCLLYFKCFGRVKFWMPKNFGRFIFGRLFCKTVTIHRIIDEQRC